MLLQTKTKKYWQITVKFWIKIKYLIKKINAGEAGEYGKAFMKTKFNSDDKFE